MNQTQWGPFYKGRSESYGHRFIHNKKAYDLASTGNMALFLPLLGISILCLHTESSSHDIYSAFGKFSDALNFSTSSHGYSPFFFNNPHTKL